MTLFDDELVLAVAQAHPRMTASLTPEQVLSEQHAVVSLESYGAFSKPYYIEEAMQRAVTQQCTDLYSVLNLVSQTEMVAIAPAWLVQQQAASLKIKAVPLYTASNKATCYLSWHESSERDKGHQWMKSVLTEAGNPG